MVNDGFVADEVEGIKPMAVGLVASVLVRLVISLAVASAGEGDPVTCVASAMRPSRLSSKPF